MIGTCDNLLESLVIGTCDSFSIPNLWQLFVKVTCENTCDNLIEW